MPQFLPPCICSVSKMLTGFIVVVAPMTGLADVVITQTNSPGVFGEVQVNQDGGSSIQMFFDIQNEVGGINGLALNSSATGDSSNNWSPTPLWETFPNSPLTAEVGGGQPDSLSFTKPNLASNGIFQFEFFLNPDLGQTVTSIELANYRVSGRNATVTSGFILGNSWSDFFANEFFNSGNFEAFTHSAIYDSSFDTDVVGETDFLLLLDFSSSTDNFRIFEEDGGQTIDRFSITVNFGTAVPEPTSGTFCIIGIAICASLRRRNKQSNR